MFVRAGAFGCGQLIQIGDQSSDKAADSRSRDQTWPRSLPVISTWSQYATAPRSCKGEAELELAGGAYSPLSVAAAEAFANAGMLSPARKCWILCAAEDGFNGSERRPLR